MQRVEIELPESVYRQLQRVAEETSQWVAMLEAHCVMSNLPPSAADASPELRGALLRMQSLETSDLLKVAQSQLAISNHERQAELLEKNQEGPLTETEH